jgi:hypothetical protein
MRGTAYASGVFLVLACAGCNQGDPAARPPYDSGYADGVWAAKAQKSKGRGPDLKQTLSGRRDLAEDAGYEPGDAADQYREGFTSGYNNEFNVMQ